MRSPFGTGQVARKTIRELQLRLRHGVLKKLLDFSRCRVSPVSKDVGQVARLRRSLDSAAIHIVRIEELELNLDTSFGGKGFTNRYQSGNVEGFPCPHR